jgi:hypothetical protein
MTRRKGEINHDVAAERFVAQTGTDYEGSRTGPAALLGRRNEALGRSFAPYKSDAVDSRREQLRRET